MTTADPSGPKGPKGPSGPAHERDQFIPVRKADLLDALVEHGPLGSEEPRADEPGSGRVSGARTLEMPRWPLALLASAAARLGI